MKQSDVIIVGAGVAGLTAANVLRKQAPDLRVRVIEAGSRAGGRIWTHRVWADRDPLELGAEFIHDSIPARTSPLRAIRGQAVQWGTGRFFFDGRIAAGHGPRIRDARCGMDCWIHRYKNGTGSVGGVLASWPSLARQIAAADVEGEYAASPKHLSLSAAYQQWNEWEGGAGDFYPRSNYSTLVYQLSRRLDLSLGQPITAIKWRPGEVEVETASRTRYRARCAIITVSLGVLRSGQIRFSPRLPTAKQAAIRGLGFGNVVKVLVRVKKAPSSLGYALSDCPVPIWWPRKIRGGTILVGWAAGQSADALSRLGNADIKCRAAQSLGSLFPQIHPVDSEDIHVVDWNSEPYIRGAYSHTPVNRSNTKLRADLARPEMETLFFAGEATDRVYYATTTGAANSGKCAAERVKTALGKQA